MQELIVLEDNSIDEALLSECIDSKVNENLDNESMIALYAMDAYSVLTAVQARADELEKQGVLSRFWNSITGQQRKLNINNQKDLAHAQLLAQKMLEDLSEKNAISFEIALTLSDKVELMEQDLALSKEKINEAFGETFNQIKQVYENLNSFFDKVKEKIESLENEFRRNDDLLFWKETLLEHKVYKGKFYDDLSDAQKIICISKEFYEVTRGQWNSRDIAFLRSSLRALGMNPTQSIKPISLLEEVQKDQDLFEFMVSKCSLKDGVENLSINTPLIASIKMIDQLRSSDRHIIDTIMSFKDDLHREDVELEYISNSFLYKYGRNLRAEHNCFDVAVDLLGDFLLNDLENSARASRESSQIAVIKDDNLKESDEDVEDGYGYAFVRSVLNNTASWIKDIYVNEGEFVREGQPLALLEPSLSAHGELVFVVAKEDMTILKVNEKTPGMVIYPLFNVDKEFKGLDPNVGGFFRVKNYFEKKGLEIKDLTISDLELQFCGSPNIDTSSMSDLEFLEAMDAFESFDDVSNLDAFIRRLKKIKLASNLNKDDIKIYIQPYPTKSSQIVGDSSAMFDVGLVLTKLDEPVPGGLFFPFHGHLKDNKDYVIISRCAYGTIDHTETICSVIKNSDLPKSCL